MKIKIKPYPNYEISERAYKEDVLLTVEKGTDSTVLTNKLIMIVEFKTGEKRVVKVRPVRFEKKLYLSVFPNPIHLFLSLAIEHYDISENFKTTNFPKCGKKLGEDVYFLDIEENGTHECYNCYIKYRVSSIIMVVSAIEAYLNHIIPNDFIYLSKRGNKSQSFNKIDIESSKISFQEKLVDILPLVSDISFDWNNLLKEKDAILDLYANRKNLIHLKTNAADDFERYFDVIDKMLDFDIPFAIDSSIKIMNSARKNFVEFEKE